MIRTIEWSNKPENIKRYKSGFTMFKQVGNFIKSQFPFLDFIPLHEPRFIGNEKKYLTECIDSTFVSSVGKYVDEFEKRIAEYTGAKYGVACVNGTSALHMAMIASNVKSLLQKPLHKFKKEIKYEMYRITSTDIDTEVDWLWAEFLIKNNFV